MRGTLLTIGDELLIGQVINSNAAWMGEKLTDINCPISTHLTVGDRKDAIRSALDFLLPQSDFIIIGGGLGPTHDDLTMEILSEVFGIPLDYDSEWVSKIEEYFRSKNRPMSENNRKQGYLLRGATRIDNDCGTAAGQHLIIQHSSRPVDLFVVPGVPYEMKSMMERFILPELAKRTLGAGERILKISLLTTGVGESLLAQRCEPFVQKIKSLKSVSLAFLPSPTQVKLRLQMTARTPEDLTLFESLVEELKSYCGKDYFGNEPDTLEKKLIEELTRSGRTLALAESCTGGLIAHRLTEIPGSSQALKGSMVTYQTELKIQELGISESLIQNHGVVSEAVAKAMAESIRTKWSASFGIASTGYLGPSGGDAFASVGTIWVAVAGPLGTEAKKLNLENHRERNKERSAQAALDLLRRSL